MYRVSTAILFLEGGDVDRALAPLVDVLLEGLRAATGRCSIAPLLSQNGAMCVPLYTPWHGLQPDAGALPGPVSLGGRRLAWAIK